MEKYPAARFELQLVSAFAILIPTIRPTQTRYTERPEDDDMRYFFEARVIQKTFDDEHAYSETHTD
jgi:hypothetical protein